MPKELNLLFALAIFSGPLIYQYLQLVKIKEGKKSHRNAYVFTRVFFSYFLLAIAVDLVMIFFNPPPEDCTDCGIVLYIMPLLIIGIGLLAAFILNFTFFRAKLK
ncbi:MAG: hypothetical protein ACXWDO_08690 [Bacteroidia bacterium]